MSSTDERGNTTTDTYNAAGLVIDVHDVARNTDTRSIYNAVGENIQTNNPDGTVVRTTYDAQGNPTYTTDAYVPGVYNDPPPVTRMLYDGAGQTVGTQRWSNLSIVLVTASTGQETSVVEAADGTVFNPYNLTQYNDLPINRAPGHDFLD